MAYVCQTCGVRLAWLAFRPPHFQLIVCTTPSYTGNHEYDGLCGVVTVRYAVVVPRWATS